jgi:hypothetical protein
VNNEGHVSTWNFLRDKRLPDNLSNVSPGFVPGYVSDKRHHRFLAMLAQAAGAVLVSSAAASGQRAGFPVLAPGAVGPGSAWAGARWAGHLAAWGGSWGTSSTHEDSGQSGFE